MSLYLLPHNIAKPLVDYYTEHRLKSHLDNDPSTNPFNRDWTSPSAEIKQKCSNDLDRLLNGPSLSSRLFSYLSLSNTEANNLNSYFGKWNETVYLFYSFLNNNQTPDIVKFSLRTDDNKVHKFQVEKKPTKLQPGNCVFAVINERYNYDENKMIDEPLECNDLNVTLSKLSYKNLIKKVILNGEKMNDLDCMQLYFLLCLEISRQLVDNALFFDSPIAALLVRENQLLRNDKITIEDTFYNSKSKTNFKLLYTYAESSKAVDVKSYRKQYEFSLILGLFGPEKTFFKLYSEQPNILYEHIENDKQASVAVKYAILERRGQEMMKTTEKNGNEYKINGGDLNELNQFARSKLFYELMKEMRDCHDYSGKICETH